MRDKESSKSTLNIQLFVVIAMIGMCLVHCRLFAAYYMPYDQLPFQMPRESVRYIGLLGLISMCFPIAAGEFLRVRLAEPIRFKQWNSIDRLLPLKLLLFLAMLDSLKNLFSMGFYNFIRWDILPFMALSLWLIMKTLKWGRRVALLPAMALALQVLAELFIPVFRELVIFTPAQVQIFKGSTASTSAMLISLLLVLCIFHYLMKDLNRKIQFGMFVSVAFLFSLFHLNYWSSAPTYGASIFNLPFLALTPMTALGGHIWPLTPWLWLPVAGFLFRHFIEENPDQKLKLLIKYALDFFFVLYFIFYFVSLYPDYYLKFDARYLFSQRIFSARMVDICGVVSMYWLLRRLCEGFASLVDLPLRLLRIVCSGSVIFYVIHYLIAYWTVHTWAVLIKSPQISYWAYTSFVGFTSIGISSLLVALYQGKVLLFIKKV